MGEARGMGFAVRKEVVSVVAAAELGVWEVPSSLLGSGVVCLEACVLKVGRKRLVNDGLGGKGVGGRL